MIAKQDPNTAGAVGTRSGMPVRVRGTGACGCRQVAGRSGERRLGLPRRGPSDMATVDALDWTRAIARGAGAGIGAITNADTNIFTVTATYTTETSDSSTSMIGKDIKTVMAVNFRVE